MDMLSCFLVESPISLKNMRIKGMSINYLIIRLSYPGLEFIETDLTVF